MKDPKKLKCVLGACEFSEQGVIYSEPSRDYDKFAITFNYCPICFKYKKESVSMPVTWASEYQIRSCIEGKLAILKDRSKIDDTN